MADTAELSTEPPANPLAPPAPAPAMSACHNTRTREAIVQAYGIVAALCREVRDDDLEAARQRLLSALATARAGA